MQQICLVSLQNLKTSLIATHVHYDMFKTMVPKSEYRIKNEEK